MTIAQQEEHERGDEENTLRHDDPRATIGPSSPSLTDRPIDFIFEEHLRQRQLAKILCLIADGVVNRKTIATVIDFIRSDLATHVGDEELCFFPMLRQQCPADDNIAQLLDILADEHRGDEKLSAEIVAILHSILTGAEIGDAERAKLTAFADHLRRHIALENGVLLPIAEARLDAAAKSLLSASLAQRRSRKS